MAGRINVSAAHAQGACRRLPETVTETNFAVTTKSPKLRARTILEDEDSSSTLAFMEIIQRMSGAAKLPVDTMHLFSAL